MKHTFFKILIIAAAAVFLCTALVFPAAAVKGDAVNVAVASDNSGTASATVSKEESSSSSQPTVSERTSSAAVSSREESSVSSEPKASFSSRQTSDNNTLKKLTVSGGTLLPSFKPGTLSYGMLVANNVTKLTIKAVPEDSGATVYIGGRYKNLQVGMNIITINVTAGNGDTKTYRISVTRSSQKDSVIDSAALAAYLKGLEQSEAAANGSSGASASNNVLGNLHASNLPTGMLLLIAAAVFCGGATGVTLLVIKKRHR